MNKKLLFVLLAVLVSAVFAGAFIAVQRSQTPINTAPRADSITLPTPITKRNEENKNTALKEYSDPSGFRFLYPSTVTMNVEQSEDPDSYASIKLKAEPDGGYISLKIIASTFSRLDEWLKANSISKASPGLRKISLADLDAYQTTIGTQKITGAIDTGIALTFVLTDPDDPILSAAYDTIITNFSFYEPKAPAEGDQAPAAAQSTSQEIVEDEGLIE